MRARPTPLVSCIMPTRNRRRFVGQAVRYFLRQDYPARELVVVDDGDDSVADLLPPDDPRIRYHRARRRLPLGAKRNLACELARGALVAHWDDDDWMAPDRLSRQVEALLAAGADACGHRHLLHYHLAAGEAWLYRYPDAGRPWLVGGTLLYRREAWEAHRFPPLEVGEDTGFVRRLPPERLCALEGPPCYVAVIHGANSSAKNLRDRHWERRPLAEVGRLLGEDRAFYTALRGGGAPRPVRAAATPAPVPEAPAAPAGEPPLVSCIMPTADRRPFVARAIEYFLRQDYPNTELVIVDDGADAVADLAARDPRITYLRAPRGTSIGAKRNAGCQAARGEIVACWDDDDWHAPDRLSYQAAPLLAGRADATALEGTVLVEHPAGRFWACSARVRDTMFFYGVVGGTVVFHRRSLERARFPDASLAEDAGFLRALLRRGARLEKLPNAGRFLYVRHGRNSWRFPEGRFVDAAGWREVEPPAWLPAEDRAFYGRPAPAAVEAA
ncbi:MAG TPA: glycosyltransferase family A protein [Longimicrobiaceae bacterium]|nr:glycosyltransferase family A protein [Longimicrobiaceae bacterium]